jgi:Icc-related predicted phosphoesterase
MRFFALSDLHVDYAENRNWVRELSPGEYRSDVLLLAGDLSSDLEVLEDCLCRLRERFCALVFVPGNHDLWVRRREGLDSLAKWERVAECCRRSDVHVSGVRFGAVRVEPLLSWYDFSFGRPNEELRQRWADFKLCVWPGGMSLDEVNAWFLAQNHPLEPQPGETLLTLSHFLPRPDVLPERVDLDRYWLLPVLGSHALGSLVERLNPWCHVFGHTHLNSRRRHSGITYLNNAFGYPSEVRIARKALLQLPMP